MTRREFLRLAMQQKPEWLRECLDDPSPHWRPIHVLLVRVALRRIEDGKK